MMILTVLLLIASVWLQPVWVVAHGETLPDRMQPNRIVRPTAKIHKYTVQDPRDSSADRSELGSRKETSRYRSKRPKQYLSTSASERKRTSSKSIRRRGNDTVLPECQGAQGERPKGGSLTSRMSLATHNYWIFLENCASAAAAGWNFHRVHCPRGLAGNVPPLC